MKCGVFIAPADMQEVANGFSEVMNWGPMVYSVALSPTGAEPATHFACRADLAEGFLAMLQDIPEGAPPFIVTGIDPDEVRPEAIDGFILIHLAERGNAFAHWSTVIADYGLQMVQDPGFAT